MSGPESNLVTLLQGAGLCCDFAGVLSMANAYTAPLEGRYKLPRLFPSALYRGDAARSVASWRWTGEERPAVLQGLAWIGVGFVLQLVAVGLAAFGSGGG